MSLRSTIIRLAAKLPTGDPTRRRLLAALKNAYRCPDRAPVYSGSDEWIPAPPGVEVPYSELAMHVGLAGEKVLSYAMNDRGTYAFICTPKGMTHGTPGEVLGAPSELRRWGIVASSGDLGVKDIAWDKFKRQYVTLVEPRGRYWLVEDRLGDQYEALARKLALRHKWGPGGYTDVTGMVRGATSHGGEADAEARFEEGKPADPCKNMSEAECEEWKANNEKYKDVVKDKAKRRASRPFEGGRYRAPGKTIPADIVFKEDSRGGSWKGRLLNPDNTIDLEQGGKRVSERSLPLPFWNIIENEDGSADSTFQGGNKNSRRHVWHKTVSEAQRAAVAWAGRRFRVPLYPMDSGPQDRERERGLRPMRRRAGHGLEADTLLSYIQQEARDRGLPTDGLEVTPDVQRATMMFVRALSKNLSVWLQNHPTEFGADLKDIMGEGGRGQGGAVVAYRTLAGLPGGLQDSGWVLYWSDPSERKELERFLERHVGSEYDDLRDAIGEAAEGGY